MKIKQAEFNIWLRCAIEAQQKLCQSTPYDSEYNRYRARLEVLEAVEEACCGRLSDLQALAGQGAQSAIGGGVICG